ncbi:MAG: DUF2325 domain-containing protein [Methyloversatilis sp.]|jgi:hypothetical protein|uniref:Predicted diverged CheY domain-containing protein n=1 Tax=Methyloversatilis universalis (strain ATCC BAA-1314 / DSM 25237 / JCM 13912 / CCUG 52030 / FAM5) TaxID=1000565 RepID=F5RA12_METUF|nr:DUF2325 domain-containing protein [Methyloversatilis universalis]EGK72615.1 Putative predicted diverged CheY domain-containing protein [Methyloversatilis universalis FAM5]MCP4635202.1 DUF2325 domain-containing protein [Methyloversatilis sp.]
MAILVVGGDHPNQFADSAREAGVDRLHHWSGRRAADHHQPLPRDLRGIVLLIDHVNHGMAARVRKLASANGLPVIYAARSRSQVRNALAQLAA